MSSHGNSSLVSDTAISALCLIFFTRSVVLQIWYQIKSAGIRFKRTKSSTSSNGVTQWQNLLLREFKEAKNLDRLKNTVDRNKEENSIHYN